MTQPVMTDQQVKELNEELDNLLEKEKKASDTEPPPTENTVEPVKTVEEVIRTNEEIEAEKRLRMAAEAQIAAGTMKLPGNVEVRTAVKPKLNPKAREKFIKILKEDEEDVRELLERKNAPKPTVAVVKTDETPKPLVTVSPNPEYQVFNEIIKEEPIDEEDVTVIQNRQAVEAFAYNMFHVSHQGSSLPPGKWVTITNPYFGPISPDQAINLAVWLVRYAMKAGATITYSEVRKVIDEAVASGTIPDIKV